MQDRYVGDVGDFAKYALLRHLVGTGTSGKQFFRSGVVWCLFPNESHNNDGRHISYLESSDFAYLDDNLRTILQRIVGSANRRISAIESEGILPSDTVFCDALISPSSDARASREVRLKHRFNWLRDCLAQTSDCQLIFFDPDNGVETPSIPKHHTKAGKYIFWDELTPFWNRGQSLLIYHHLNRTMPATEQVKRLAKRMHSQFGGATVQPLVFRRGSCRVFWLVAQASDHGAELARRALSLLDSEWAKHYRPASWPQGT